MSSELCPRCHAVRNMVMTTYARVITGPGGKLKKVRTDLFHCETCHAFVRSEDIEPHEETRSSIDA
ncbi:MAG: hypothetical protein JW883_04335 [Deltaproteobacteria bacterium]|jgi:hypothetical protein|nr:hypothetical protein [Deltaproteobacteria bacterium]